MAEQGTSSQTASTADVSAASWVEDLFATRERNMALIPQVVANVFAEMGWSYSPEQFVEPIKWFLQDILGRPPSNSRKWLGT